MDIISHALIARILVTPRNDKKEIIIIPFFALLPDIFQIPLYLFLGYINQRPFFFPLLSDWNGVREQYPLWVLWWELPHSIFFLLLVIAPICKFLKLNNLVILAYFSHIFIDIFTHTGEWVVKPLFPLELSFQGFTDAWAWEYYFYPITWVILMATIKISDRLRQ